jgi:hypothetical protein
VRRALAAEATEAVGSAVRIGDDEVHIFKNERSVRGDAYGTVKIERHLLESDAALDEEFAVMTKLAGAG